MRASVLKVGLGIWAASALLLACNRNSSNQASYDLDSSELATLHLRILPGRGHESVTPVQNTDDSAILSLSEAEVVDGEVALTNRIQLPAPNERPLFLVWDSQGLKSPIREATYEYQYKDANNLIQSTSEEPHEIHCDDGQGICFISLRKVFEGRENDIDPRDQQFLALRLLLANGDTVSFRVRFLLDGYLPENLRSTPSALRNPSDPEAAVNAIRTDGWSYHGETITNPTHRPLVYTLRTSLAPLELRELFGAPEFYDQSLNPIAGSSLTNRYLKSTLLPSGIRVFREASPTGEFVAFSSNGMASIRVEPQESLDLQWIASVAPGTQRSGLPGPAQTSLYHCPKYNGWAIPNPVSPIFASDAQCDYTHHPGDVTHPQLFTVTPGIDGVVVTLPELRYERSVRELYSGESASLSLGSFAQESRQIESVGNTDYWDTPPPPFNQGFPISFRDVDNSIF